VCRAGDIDALKMMPNVASTERQGARRWADVDENPDPNDAGAAFGSWCSSRARCSRYWLIAWTASFSLGLGMGCRRGAAAEK